MTSASLLAQAPAKTAVLAAGVNPGVIAPGNALKLTYNWKAVPMGEDYAVFVHFVNDKGETAFQADHEPPWPTKTSTWTGKVNYTKSVKVPKELKAGPYRIEAGLYSKKSGKQDLEAGVGTVKMAPGVFQIGELKIDPATPPPPLDSAKAPTLDLKGYRLTFSDEFDGPLDVSAWGPGTKWIAHTPYNGDFGDARFTDPSGDFPFTVKDGILTIEARKENGKWRSGLLCSVDKTGQGFAQTRGYFEMRAKFPEGPGTWPAFWLNSLASLQDKSKDGFEVDVVEQYGRAPQTLHTVLHWWNADKTHKAIGDQFEVEDMAKDFHTYGFLWDEKFMIWYFDGKELWKVPTPKEADTPLYVMINLALGSGWPIDKTPNPSKMLVDYVRVYERE
jgi:beta-glucanase (GH16 family)